jgi:hypothetical protein
MQFNIVDAEYEHNKEWCILSSGNRSQWEGGDGKYVGKAR